MASHGDILEITYSHPTLGNDVFYPKAGESNTYDLGGIRTNDDASQVAGGGQMIAQKNRMLGMFEVMIENDMIKEVSEKVGLLAADPVAAEWTFQLINGSIFVGTGFPVGDIQPDINAGTMTLKVNSGAFAKI
tara:strand:+ start:762 stop:1160 length:399 start_codon:yes stop_codon:yes gene_type:complete